MSKIDLSQFRKAALALEAAGGRVAADSLNKLALQSIIGSGSGKGAMQLTKVADASSIAAVPEKVIRGRVIKRLRAKGLLKGATRQVIKKAVVAERKARQNAKGYAAFVGWNNTAKDFGGRGIKGKPKGIKGITERFPNSKARFGSGKKATPRSTKAVMENTVDFADKIGGTTALEQGVKNGIADFIPYAEKKIAAAAKRAGFWAAVRT